MSDASSRLFLFAHLRSVAGTWQGLSDRLDPLLSAWTDVRNMGVFMGLFGVRNQDVFVLLSLPAGCDAGAQLRARLPGDVEVLDCLPLSATVRPHDDEPHTRAGIYVFRFFDVAAADVQEVASLSKTAWETFESGDSAAGGAYASEPVALFRFADPLAARGRMLLLTWYDNLTSWERSRSPHPDATANFRRRAALSKSVIAYATRLASTMPR